MKRGDTFASPLFIVLSWSLLFSEGHTHALQKRTSFLVVLRRGADDNIHTSYPVEGVIRNFREDELLLQPHGIIAATIEAVWIEPLKVADAR